jgi:membrane associated rhomboid family serine protease
MIPLRDTVRSSTTPYITYALIAACSVVFLLELGLGEQAGFLIGRFAIIPMNVSATILHGTPSLAVGLTLVTALFLHGGWLHLIGNMLYLYIFGDNVEDRLGHGGFLVFYLLCGVGASLTEVIATPGSSVPVIGASGAIAGVLGAYFLLYPRARILTLIPLFLFFPVLEVPAFFFLGFWFVLQFLEGAASTGSGATGGVAWWAHTGGFLMGALLLPVFLYLSPRSHAVSRTRF